MEYGKICCAVDLSDASGFVLRRAAELASSVGAVLIVVHVDVGADTPAAPPVGAAAERGAPDLAWLRRRLDALHEEAEEITGGVVFVELLAGDPAEEIVRYAGRHDVDLLVLGTHGHSGMKRLVLGSVAEQVVRRAPCAVLVVRPKVPVTHEEEKLVEEYSAF